MSHYPLMVPVVARFGAEPVHNVSLAVLGYLATWVHTAPERDRIITELER